jgi:hypothetical protein
MQGMFDGLISGLIFIGIGIGAGLTVGGFLLYHLALYLLHHLAWV